MPDEGRFQLQMIRFLLSLCFSLVCLVSWSQISSPNRAPVPPSVEIDDVAEVPRIKEKGKFKKNWKQPYPNPTRAGIYSLIFPGAGQFYNKRYWKVPLVWGAVGGVIYWADFSAKQYKVFNTAYGLRLASERTGTVPTDEFVGIARNSESIKRARDRHDKNRQTGIIAIIGVHALQALEAYVDTHLKNFDIDDDISLRFGPVLEGSVQSGTYVGIGITAAF